MTMRIMLRTFTLFVLVWMASASQTHPARAEAAFASYCSYRSALVVLLADITTRYDDFDREQIVGVVDELLRRLRHGERVVVRTIEDTFENSRILFDACTPGCPSEGALKDLMSSCRPALARSQHLQFKQALTSAMSEVYKNSVERNQTDLLNTLRFHMSFARAYEQKELWFFSDMLENRSIRILREKATVDRLITRAVKQNLMVDLSGFQVRIYGMARTDHPDSRRRLPKAEYDKVVGFWRAYIIRNGATLQHLQE